ncbi:prepilin-type N-terminal cleavage/methylation domain-containing protein [Pontibacterium sp.]|uniref:prepilin-type N-terminal cleavage/methylation domain-containing protein n=1 Tax=Pontibacterium sp. TaxID=2036026 RepID=UPI003567E64D
MTIPIEKQQGGFTLLELVVVVAVLGLIANLATEFVAQNTNQERFEATKSRQAMIREAIIGNPSATQNGEVQVSGFIADMGRAPISLRELLTDDGYCADPDHFNIAERPNDPSWDAANECDTAAGIADTWVPELGASWKGPYLQGFDLETISYNSSSLQIRTFRDGWGNSASAWAKSSDGTNDIAYEDFLNFGWNYYIGINTAEGTGVDIGKNKNLNDLFTISAGLDGNKDPGSDSAQDRTGSTSHYNATYTAQNVYEKDYPRSEYSLTGLSNPDPEYDLKHLALINATEYLTDAIASINNNDAAAIDVCLVAWNEEISSEYVSSSYNAPVGKTNHSVQIPHGQYYVDIVFDPNPSATDANDRCNPEDIVTPVTAAKSKCEGGSVPVVLSSRTSIALQCTLK